MLNELVQEVQSNSKDALKVQALTQRIASLVAGYEEQQAEFRAQATLAQEQMVNTINALQEKNSQLHEELSGYREQADPEQTPEELAEDVPQEDK